ncbi:hypothetical protein IWW38_000731 [Coemansia aciculifera]|uniref:Uncharacterized protein n=1 Tax=Coemansia aciculifera TaxID=417176 RepID=A0ACC1M802_9FUNG|nr:hypothetical protein IWW38_000731 [Coemansia aciculifera]
MSLFSLSAILFFVFAFAPVTAAADMEPIESQAPLAHSMLGALPQHTVNQNRAAPLREGTVDRPVSGDISEMSAQDSEPKALRRRWYPYGGYGYGYNYYPYYPYGGYGYGGGAGLDLELGLGLHL